MQRSRKLVLWILALVCATALAWGILEPSRRATPASVAPDDLSGLEATPDLGPRLHDAVRPAAVGGADAESVESDSDVTPPESPANRKASSAGAAPFVIKIAGVAKQALPWVAARGIGVELRPQGQSIGSGWRLLGDSAICAIRPGFVDLAELPRVQVGLLGSAELAGTWTLESLPIDESGVAVLDLRSRFQIARIDVVSATTGVDLGAGASVYLHPSIAESRLEAPRELLEVAPSRRDDAPRKEGDPPPPITVAVDTIAGATVQASHPGYLDRSCHLFGVHETIVLDPGIRFGIARPRGLEIPGGIALSFILYKRHDWISDRSSRAVSVGETMLTASSSIGRREDAAVGLTELVLTGAGTYYLHAVIRHESLGPRPHRERRLGSRVQEWHVDDPQAWEARVMELPPDVVEKIRESIAEFVESEE